MSFLTPTLSAVSLQKPKLEKVRFGSALELPFNPLRLNPSLLLDTQHTDGANTSIPICRVRRVTEGDEVDIYGYNPDDPRQYKTTSEVVGGYGSDLVTNGTFSTDTDWTKDAEWTIGSGVASCNNSSGSIKSIQQSISIDSTKQYIISFDVVVTSGSVRVVLGAGGEGTSAYFTTSQHLDFISNVGTSDTNLYFQAASTGFVGTIDNVVVKEVIGGYYEPDERLLFPNEQFFVTTWYDQSQGLGSNIVDNLDFTNWTGDDPDDWTVLNEDVNNYVTENANGARMVSDASALLQLRSDATFSIGDFIKITVVIDSFASGSVNLRFTGSGSSLDETVSDAGTYTYYRTSTGTQFQFQRGAAGVDAVIDSVTIEVLEGNTAIQSTSANQPELYWEAASLGSELVTNGDFTNWTGDDPDDWTFNGSEDASNYVTENPAGEAQLVTDGTITLGIYQNILSQNTNYRILTDITAVTSGKVDVFSGAVGVEASFSALGDSQEKYFNSTTTNGNLSWRSTTAIADITFDNISVKEVLTWDYPVLKFDGADDFMDLTGLTSSASDYTFFSRLNITDPTIANGYIFDSNTGRLITAYPQVANKIAFYDGSWKTADFTSTDRNNLSWVLDQTNNATIYNGTAEIGSGLSYTQTAIGGTTYFGRSSASGLYLNGKMKTIQLYPRALSASNITKLNDYYT